MTQKPLVTVICLCYNHQDYVIETLQSVLNQSYSNIEIIIVDDKSSDDSVSLISDFLKDHPQIKFIKNEKNLGNTKTFNKAAKLSKGYFLLDLACDDILLPNCISIQIEAFLKTKGNATGIVFGNAENIDSEGKFISNYFPTDKNKKVLDTNLFKTDLIRILNGGLCMNSVSSMMRRSVFEQLNGYDENLAFEDLDYWIRVLEKYKIVFIDEIITQKRDLKSSLGSQILEKNKTSLALNYSMNRIYSKVINTNKEDKKVLKAVLKRIHFSLGYAIKNKNFRFIFLFGIQKIKIHYLLLTAK